MRERFERFDSYMKRMGLNDNQVTIQCNLAQGLLGQARKGKSDLGDKAIAKILNVYQDLNRVWLLTGEGEMLKPSVSQSANGNNVTQVAGNGNRVNSACSLDKALDEIAEQRKLVAKSQEQITKSQEQISKSQEQIDRLLNIIEQMTKQSS